MITNGCDKGKSKSIYLLLKENEQLIIVAIAERNCLFYVTIVVYVRCSTESKKKTMFFFKLQIHGLRRLGEI